VTRATGERFGPDREDKFDFFVSGLKLGFGSFGSAEEKNAHQGLSPTCPPVSCMHLPEL